ncbi:GyrI-like domain-containing protein [Pseudomonas sp. NPDC089569]|uniref:GyrI-like domain-containing protein n=1 Tax=Pseudomonas sp. NPDC089569 TaxID=3390722 RepID=UPI003D02D2EE
MDEPTRAEVTGPRIEKEHFLLIAGLGGRFTRQSVSGIPDLWEKFQPHIGKVPGQKGEYTYGVCCNFDGKGGFDYIAGVEISKLDDLPEQYRWVEVQPQKYAVFEHKGSLQSLPQTFHRIFDILLPQSGHEPINAPEFERYGKDFNPDPRFCRLEIWLPIKD